jgi:uncharacterized protein YdaU (DUF1376 family)
MLAVFEEQTIYTLLLFRSFQRTTTEQNVPAQRNDKLAANGTKQ